MAKRVNFWELPVEAAQPDDTLVAYRGRGKVARVKVDDVQGSGTVTSVGLSMPAGFSVANTPVTSSGTITVTFASGYGLPTTTQMGQWSTAFGWGDHAQAGYALASAVTSALAGKVDKVAGKGLSTEDYTTAEKSKLSGIEAGAQVNTVTSVAGKTGAVTLAKGDVGLGNVDNTSDADKPISTAVAAALDATVKTTGNQTIAGNLGVQRLIVQNGMTFQAYGQTIDFNAATLNNITALSTRGATPRFVMGIDYNGYPGLYNHGFVVNVKNATSGNQANNQTFQVVDTQDPDNPVLKFGVKPDGTAYATTYKKLDGTEVAYAPDLATKVDKIPGKGLSTEDYTTAEKSKLSGIADNATANTGTVTSVGVSVPTGLQVAGGPVTTSGTLTISYAPGYAIPTTAKQGQWDTAYGWGNHASAGYVTTAVMQAYTYSKSEVDSLLSGVSSGSRVWQSATTTLTKNTAHKIDFSSPRTLTLPASPSENDYVEILRLAGSTANSTIARNGQTIMGLAENLTLDADIQYIRLDFVNSSWRIAS